VISSARRFRAKSGVGPISIPRPLLGNCLGPQISTPKNLKNKLKTTLEIGLGVSTIEAKGLAFQSTNKASTAPALTKQKETLHSKSLLQQHKPGEPSSSHTKNSTFF
jgi:hypothetical protein